MEISFRPLQRADFNQLQLWLSSPHVKAWWHDDLDAQEIEKKYGPRVDGSEATHVFIILFKGKDIGLIQYYLWDDYPSHATQLKADKNSAGIDLAIGDAQMVGQGLGSKIITEFLQQIVFLKTDAKSVITDPEEKNVQSLKAFAKAGFKPLRSVQLQDESYKRCVVGFNKNNAK